MVLCCLTRKSKELPIITNQLAREKNFFTISVGLKSGKFIAMATHVRHWTLQELISFWWLEYVMNLPILSKENKEKITHRFTLIQFQILKPTSSIKLQEFTLWEQIDYTLIDILTTQAKFTLSLDSRISLYGYHTTPVFLLTNLYIYIYTRIYRNT